MLFPILLQIYTFMQTIVIADIFQECKLHYSKPQPLCPVQQKAFEDIVACRTSELGGHTLYCGKCGNKVQSYNSCRNRNCPKCQYIKRMQWVDKLAANLPPVKHFHIVFTIPSCLHNLFYINQQVAHPPGGHQQPPDSETFLISTLLSTNQNTSPHTFPIALGSVQLTFILHFRNALQLPLLIF